MFKNLFGGDKTPSPKQPDGSRSQALGGQNRPDAHKLLEMAQDGLQRLRVMQPTDAEAFPLLNETSRYGGWPVYTHMPSTSNTVM